MIQDISPHIFDNKFDCPSPKPSDTAVLFFENSVLLKKDGNGFPAISDLGFLSGYESVYLFSMDAVPVFLIDAAVDEDSLPNGLYLSSTVIFRSALPEDVAFLGASALHLSSWMNKNRICSCCGAKTELSKKERALECPNCKNTVYPYISPAIIVAVLNGDKILMGRKSENNPYYSLIAGYCEVGESLEVTVAREVYEEAGLKVKDIKYYSSQPWAFSSSLMIGFTAVLDGDDTVNLNDHELFEAVWFSREDVLKPTSLFSVGSTMIQDFIDGKI